MMFSNMWLVGDFGHIGHQVSHRGEWQRVAQLKTLCGQCLYPVPVRPVSAFWFVILWPKVQQPGLDNVDLTEFTSTPFVYAG